MHGITWKSALPVALALLLWSAGVGFAQDAAGAAEGPTCKLITEAAPAGGRLEVQGSGMGKSPLIKVGGKLARLIERRGDTIAVQIPKPSEGGEVLLIADKKKARCGSLKIVGDN